MTKRKSHSSVSVKCGSARVEAGLPAPAALPLFEVSHIRVHAHMLTCKFTPDRDYRVARDQDRIEVFAATYTKVHKVRRH